MNIRAISKEILLQISPKLVTKIIYYLTFHKFPNLNDPQDFNEKLQYLKLNTYYNNPLVTTYVDKYAAKGLLKEKGYESIVPKLIDYGTNANEIKEKWDTYPNQFVLKCNHGSSYNILVKDKNKFDVDKVVAQVDEWLKEDYWRKFCETQYRFIDKKYLVEEYLGDEIKTYKFYCFSGVPKMCYVISNGPNGEEDLYYDYFDLDWNHLSITLKGHEHDPKEIKCPDSFKKMIEIAGDLSKEFPFVRVDLYDIDGKVYFSELTFIPTGGLISFEPKSALDDIGKMIKLPKDKH